ncbi:MAG: hypothetical protein ACRD6X_08505, partial [Pyrinomonadaceae bacterium]
MYQLNETELVAFREEFQEKEREIQRYIGVYLSGLVLVTGWIIGPQSTPILKMVLGNGGYSVYGVMIIVSLNVLFTCFLLYKSLIVHEINQFITYQTPAESGFKYWESWRRSKYSATKPARGIYSGLLAVLPIAVSALLLYGLWKLFHANVSELVETLTSLTVAPTPVDGKPNEPSAIPDAHGLASVLNTARYWYYLLITIHILPLWFLFLNWIPNDRRWNSLIK